MKRRYQLPVKGTVIKREPLMGAEDDPICVIPFQELIPSEAGGYLYECLNYNIDEEWCEVELEASNEFHEWLLSILPQLKDIQKKKGWKLEKKYVLAD